MKSVHENLKPFECHICLQTFGLNWNLKKHIKTVHKILYLLIVKYKCNLCAVTTVRKGGLLLLISP
jgi:hypothetical protein